MKRLFPILLLAGLLSGCMTWRDSEKVWADSQEKRIIGGPGSEDTVCFHWHRDRYLVDKGTRLSVGIFPGIGQAWVDDSVDGVDYVNSLWLIPIGSVFANLVVLAPTISSLFIAPFDEASLSSFGFIGCHRWSIKPTEERIRRGPAERVLLRHAESKWQAPAGDVRTGTSADGTLLFLEYPGFDRLLATVKTKGKADVKVGGGQVAYRRFHLSKHVPDGLAYRDVLVTQEKTAGR